MFSLPAFACSGGNDSQQKFAVAQGGHVIMLGGGNDEAARAALAAYPGGLQVGGGITPERARPYLEAGASHVPVFSCPQRF